jgi:hypothetical protein
LAHACRPLAFCVLTCCVLPACATTASSTAAGTAAVRSAPAISAVAFTTVVPQGWTNTINNSTEVQKLSAGGRVVYLVEQAPPGQTQPNLNDVRANINVVDLAQMVPDDQLNTYLNSVSQSGATNLSTPQQFILDGATGQYLTYDRDIQGTPGESRDMAVNHGTSTYHIVLNTSRFAFNQQLTGLQAILAAWKWSPP